MAPAAGASAAVLQRMLARLKPPSAAAAQLSRLGRGANEGAVRFRPIAAEATTREAAQGHSQEREREPSPLWAEISLDRPERRNALTGGMMRALGESVHVLAQAVLRPVEPPGGGGGGGGGNPSSSSSSPLSSSSSSPSSRPSLWPRGSSHSLPPNCAGPGAEPLLGFSPAGVVLRGAGGFFCSGSDLDLLTAASQDDAATMVDYMQVRRLQGSGNRKRERERERGERNETRAAQRSESAYHQQKTQPLMSGALLGRDPAPAPAPAPLAAAAPTPDAACPSRRSSLSPPHASPCHCPC